MRRMPPNRTPRAYYERIIPGKIPIGRPREDWEKQVFKKSGKT